MQSIVRLSLARYQAYANPPQVIADRLEQFTGCADWSKGVARIRCPDCGHSYFRPFSCKVFHLCPSCAQKRTLLYAEYLAEDLLLDLPHRQFVFTIPKMLRPYFKADKLFSAKYPGCCSPCFRSFSRLQPDRNCSVPWS